MRYPYKQSAPAAGIPPLRCRRFFRCPRSRLAPHVLLPPPLLLRPLPKKLPQCRVHPHRASAPAAILHTRATNAPSTLSEPALRYTLGCVWRKLKGRNPRESFTRAKVV